MIKRIFLITIVLFSVFIALNLTQRINNALQANARLEQSLNELNQLQRQNSELKSTLAKVQTVEFVESQSRDKLNLGRPGETVVLIDQAAIDQFIKARQKPIEKPVPYWQGWLNLFI